MSDFDYCYAFMESNEDSTNLHKQVPDDCPVGCAGPCWAISGINSGAFPVQFAVIAAIPQVDRGPTIQAFYQNQFWSTWLGAIDSDVLAACVFDATVNMGARQAVRLLQQAVNAIGLPLAADGVFGTKTLTAVNTAPAQALTLAFQQLRHDHYLLADAHNPALPGLLARALRMPPSAA